MAQWSYTDIAGYVLDGKSDAEIQEILELDPRTVHDIRVKDIHRYAIAEWGLVVVDPVTRERSGPLITLYNGVEDPGAKALLVKFLNHLLDNPSSQVVATSTDPTYAAAWHQMEEVLAQMPGPVLGVVLTPERRAILHDLHGGRKFAGVTEADIARVRRRHLLDSAILAAQSAFSRDEGASDIEDAFVGELGGW